VNNNETSSFLDRRTLTAIFLVFATWMGWQYYMQVKYPHYFEKKTTEQAPADDSKAKGGQPTSTPPVSAAKVEPPAAAVLPRNSAEKTMDFKSSNLSFQISSKGMGVRDLTLLQYFNRKNEPVEFSQKQPPLSFETR